MVLRPKDEWLANDKQQSDQEDSRDERSLHATISFDNCHTTTSNTTTCIMFNAISLLDLVQATKVKRS